MSCRTAIPFTVEVDGGTLHGLEWPAGRRAPTVLGVHGITANAASWRLVAERLSGVRVVAVDLRGRGRSNALGAPWSLEQHARDLEHVVSARGLGRPVVAGHSMGGFVAVQLAAVSPELAERLVLVDGGLPTPPLAPLPDSTSATPESLLGPAVTRLEMTFASHDEYREFWRTHPAFGPWWNDAMTDYVDYDLEPVSDGRWRPSTTPEAMLANLRELDGRSGYAEVLAELRTPTVFVRAPRGLTNAAPLYPARYAQDQLARLPHVRSLEAADTNHYTVVLAPHGADTVAAVLRDELAAAERTAAARAAHPSTGTLRIVTNIPSGPGAG